MHLWIQPALLVYEIMFAVGSKLLTTTHFKLGIKKRKTCIINIFPRFLISSFLHCEMSVVWQIWGRKNSLLSPSDDYVPTINMFPIVAKKEVKKEWKTGRDGFHPKLKQQVLCLSASERTTKAKHVLISRPSNTLDVYCSERNQGFAWKQLVARCLRLWKLHWARIQDSSADGVGMSCCIFCKNQHCRSGLFFELLGS